jgi:hypothetical protein
MKNKKGNMPKFDEKYLSELQAKARHLRGTEIFTTK